MESPVVVENCPNFNQPVEPNNTGFPFDDSDYDSHDHLQARLNDIAARHPEFATHFRDFDNFGSLRRKRHGSGTAGDSEERAGPSHRFADHSFPSGFNRFPFTSHFEEEEPHRENKPPEVPKHEKRGRKPNPYLPQHLSNTVDLGQKQPPVQEARSQRSMSAPPENRSQSSRFESEPSNPEDMGKTFSRQPQQQAQQSQPPKERIIPIHVEGRDDPVLPKNPNVTPNTSTEKVFGGEKVQSGTYPGYAQQRQTDPHAQYRRQMYDQFTPQSNYPPQYSHQQQQFTRQQTPPSQPSHQQPQFTKQQTPPTQQQQQQQQQQHQQQQYQQQPPPPPQWQHAPSSTSNDPLDKIKSVRSDVMELMTQVEKFRGTRKDREYLYLDEMLTRNLLKLDNVETEGKDNIRQARKEAIKCIQTCISNLEAKAQAKEMELKNADTPQPEEISVETIESQKEITNSALELNEPSKETTEAPKYVSEATLFMSTPPPKTEQSKQKEDKLEINTSAEKQEPIIEETNTTETPQELENPEQINPEKNESQALPADDSSQSANQGSAEK